MTNNQHGQVPEALIDLIDAYAETRHRCGGIYNARTEAARNAVIEALSGVQALSAAPAGFVPKAAPGEPSDASDTLSKVCDLFQIGKLARSESTILINVENAIRFSNMLNAVEHDMFPQPDLPEDDDPYAEMDENPPAPNKWGAKDEADYVAQFRAALLARGFATPQQEAQEPALWMNEKGHTWSHSDWKQFPKHRAKYPIPLYPHFPAPQPAPAPLSDDVVKDAARYRWLRDFHHGDVQDELPYIAAGEGYDGAWALTGEDADKEIDAAIAAQGGRDAG